MTINFDFQVPRLRVSAGAGDGSTGLCGMQVISWENGDTTITDFPDCVDPMLARVVQRLNDTICTHSGDGLLCPDCSVVVLEVAHSVVGTAGVASHADYVAIAVRLARGVAHLNSDPRVMAAIEAAEMWLAHPSADAAYAANAANAAAGAAYAAADAADAADAAYAAHAANAAADAAYAAAYAVDAANAAVDAAYAAYAADAADADPLANTRHVIEVWREVTGWEPLPYQLPVPLDAATARMLEVSA